MEDFAPSAATYKLDEAYALSSILADVAYVKK